MTLAQRYMGLTQPLTIFGKTYPSAINVKTKTIKDFRAESTLNMKLRYAEGIMTRREFMELKKRQGWQALKEDKRNYAAEEKLQEYLHINAFNIPFGNENHPLTKAYNEKKAELKAGIFKTVFFIQNNSSIYDITKTEYDYFNSL